MLVPRIIKALKSLSNRLKVAFFTIQPFLSFINHTKTAGEYVYLAVLKLHFRCKKAFFSVREGSSTERCGKDIVKPDNPVVRCNNAIVRRDNVNVRCNKPNLKFNNFQVKGNNLQVVYSQKNKGNNHKIYLNETRMKVVHKYKIVTSLVDCSRYLACQIER